MLSSAIYLVLIYIYLSIFFLVINAKCIFGKVGYKVRLEGMKGRDTRLLFCTTGILLRRLLVDRDLKGVSHVIVDEIHERGMNEGLLASTFLDTHMC